MYTSPEPVINCIEWYLVKDNSSLDNRLSSHRIKAHLPLIQFVCLVDNPRHIDSSTICVCGYSLATDSLYHHCTKLTKIINGSWKFVRLTERTQDMDLLLEDLVR